MAGNDAVREAFEKAAHGLCAYLGNPLTAKEFVGHAQRMLEAHGPTEHFHLQNDPGESPIWSSWCTKMCCFR